MPLFRLKSDILDSYQLLSEIPQEHATVSGGTRQICPPAAGQPVQPEAPADSGDATSEPPKSHPECLCLDSPAFCLKHNVGMLPQLLYLPSGRLAGTWRDLIPPQIMENTPKMLPSMFFQEGYKKCFEVLSICNFLWQALLPKLLEQSVHFRQQSLHTWAAHLLFEQLQVINLKYDKPDIFRSSRWWNVKETILGCTTKT